MSASVWILRSLRNTGLLSVARLKSCQREAAIKGRCSFAVQDVDFISEYAASVTVEYIP